MWPPGPTAQSVVPVDSEDQAPFELRASLDQRRGGGGGAVRVTDVAPDSRDFSEPPGGPGLRLQHVRCGGQGPNPWSRDEGPHMPHGAAKN